MARIIPFIIALVLLVGLADSVYLAMRDLGVLGSDRELTSSTCPIFGGQDCETVMSAEDALPLGVPVVLGAVYFAVMLGAAAVRILSGKWLLPGLMVLGFLAGLAYSGYLTYTMVVVLRAVCPYCMLAHSLNVAAFALFITSLVLDIRFAHNRS